MKSLQRIGAELDSAREKSIHFELHIKLSLANNATVWKPSGVQQTYDDVGKGLDSLDLRLHFGRERCRTGTTFFVQNPETYNVYNVFG